MSPKPWNDFFIHNLGTFLAHGAACTSDGWTLTVSACIASHSWGDWILWARSLVASWGLIDKTNVENVIWQTKKWTNNTPICQKHFAQLNRTAVLLEILSLYVCGQEETDWKPCFFVVEMSHPSGSLLSWSQKLLMLSQSVSLFRGLVALSTETHTTEVYSAYYGHFLFSTNENCQMTS